jgi:hypothetical protein
MKTKGIVHPEDRHLEAVRNGQNALMIESGTSRLEMDGEVNLPLQRRVARFVRLRRTGSLAGLKPGH